MNKKLLSTALISALLLSTLAGVQLVNLAAGKSEGWSPPVLAMPEEYINYTITRVNGTLWAKIDGTYPIRNIFKAGDTFERNDVIWTVISDDLPMVYPIPPGTTNIHVKLDNTELNWSSWEPPANPNVTHHTAIGDWSMIYCEMNPAPENFTLKIHYEHPLAVVNGSYLFLYDLNISPYLSPWSPNSTAHFNIRMETDSANIRAYTTETDSIWNPKNYTLSKEGTTEIISIQMCSELSKPLAGDLVVMFDNSPAQMPGEPPYWVIVPLLIVAVIVALIVYRKKHRR